MCVHPEPRWVAVSRRFHRAAVATLQWIRAELLDREDSD